MVNRHTKDMCMNGIFAAVFVVLTMINPLSWSIIQFRFSDMMSVVPYYQKRFISGFLIGGAIANMFSPLGAIDVICGTACEAIPILIFAVGFGKTLPIWVKNIGRALAIGVIIGAELTAVYHTPFIMGFISLFASEVIIFAVGSVIMGTIMRLSERAI